jgi:hypothetical protein
MYVQKRLGMRDVLCLCMCKKKDDDEEGSIVVVIVADARVCVCTKNGRCFVAVFFDGLVGSKVEDEQAS